MRRTATFFGLLAGVALGIGGITVRASAAESSSEPDIGRVVEDELLWDPDIAPRPIEVNAEEGIVVLSGAVDSDWEKRRVESIVRNVPGVTSVESDLLVEQDGDTSGLRNSGKDERLSASPLFRRVGLRFAAGSGQVLLPHRREEWMAQRVRTLFRRDPVLASRNILVSVLNNQVWLSGIVFSKREKHRAEVLARSVHGVFRVENELFVHRPYLGFKKPGLLPPVGGPFGRDPFDLPYAYPPFSYPFNQPPFYGNPLYGYGGVRPFSDAEIRLRIEDWLFRESFFDASSVRMTVRNGIVTWLGSVESWQDRQEAERQAYDAGARQVINRLRVGPW